MTTVQQALSFWRGSGSGSKAARLDAQKWLLQQLVHLRLKVCLELCKGASAQELQGCQSHQAAAATCYHGVKAIMPQQSVISVLPSTIAFTGRTHGGELCHVAA